MYRYFFAYSFAYSLSASPSNQTFSSPFWPVMNSLALGYSSTSRFLAIKSSWSEMRVMMSLTSGLQK